MWTYTPLSEVVSSLYTYRTNNTLDRIDRKGLGQGNGDETIADRNADAGVDADAVAKDILPSRLPDEEVTMIWVPSFYQP
ncbi:predicted protein [Botrytis cinerea T4]|uniref:Uncharacterized protein n=1 Tax=Botryotinia fuckeliana (strain T4) TaxID=999810 RepID=G2Y4B0_BOTF4|nr:predicted protein [Botrytis cinerea T4]